MCTSYYTVEHRLQTVSGVSLIKAIFSPSVEEVLRECDGKYWAAIAVADLFIVYVTDLYSRTPGLQVERWYYGCATAFYTNSCSAEVQVLGLEKVRQQVLMRWICFAMLPKLHFVAIYVLSCGYGSVEKRIHT